MRTYEPEWELFDLEADPYELNNIVADPAQCRPGG